MYIINTNMLILNATPVMDRSKIYSADTAPVNIVIIELAAIMNTVVDIKV